MTSQSVSMLMWFEAFLLATHFIQNSIHEKGVSVLYSSIGSILKTAPFVWRIAFRRPLFQLPSADYDSVAVSQVAKSYQAEVAPRR